MQKEPRRSAEALFWGKLSSVLRVFRDHAHDGLRVEGLLAAVEGVAVFTDDGWDAEPFAFFRLVEV